MHREIDRRMLRNPREVLEAARAMLAEGDVLSAERQCARALEAARRADDFQSMADLAAALWQARAAKIELARHAGPRAIVARIDDVPTPIAPGLYLMQPPMIGADGRTLQETADRRKAPAMVLSREPMTRKGKWPIVGVGTQVVRVLIDPPEPLERVEKAITKDKGDVLPDATWFIGAAVALGDAALRAVDPEDPPQHRVDDLLDFLEAHPLHEALHTALIAACRESIDAPPPPFERRRGAFDDPFGF